jgi:hypothetical protein
MKINGPDRTGQASVPAKGAKPAAPGFSISEAEEAADAAATGQALGVSGVGSVDALLALQQVDGPLERRKRAVRRAGRILDVLDEMRLALLDGRADPVAAQKLASAVREERLAIEEPGLSDVLDEIETRAQVELAKLEMARKAA